jgi:hypothetical protein
VGVDEQVEVATPAGNAAPEGVRVVQTLVADSRTSPNSSW